MRAQYALVTKLLIILALGGALAELFAPAPPPLLIDSAPAAPAVALDVAD